MSKFKIGIQLYTLREEMEKDVEATLKAVAEMGYDCVEFAGYFGKTAEEMKALLDCYGLEAISVHQGYDPFIGADAQAQASTKMMDLIMPLMTLFFAFSFLPSRIPSSAMPPISAMGIR